MPATALHLFLFWCGEKVWIVNYKNPDCFKFWKLAKTLKIGDIVALWCNVEPASFRQFQAETGLVTSCADAKRAAIEDALIHGELDYIDEGTPYKGGLWMGNPVEELIQKNRLRIEKEKLKEWFNHLYLSGQLDEIPTFLDDEKQEALVLQQQRSLAEQQAAAPADDDPLFDDLDKRTQSNFVRLFIALNELANAKKGGISLDKNYNKEHNALINAALDRLGYSQIGEAAYKTLIDLIREKRQKGL